MSTTTTTTTTTTSTTQPPYSCDDDLTNIRTNILNLGIAEWQLSHYKARDLINRDLEAFWYRTAAEKEGVDYRETPFTPARMLNWEVQVIDLSVYKVLELAYEILAKDVAEDNFLLLSDRYKKKYQEELKRVIASGIDYDWDNDQAIDSDEIASPYRTRRLRRI